MNKMMIVDDDPLVRKALGMLFRTEHYEILLCESGEQAIEKLEAFHPDIVLLDLRLGDMDGLEVLRQIKRRNEHVRVIILTAYGSIENTVQAMREGAFDYIQKPFDNRNLKDLVKKGLQWKQEEDDDDLVDLHIPEERKDKVPRIIGKSPQIKRVYEVLRRIAQSDDTTVLIEGESGTGKELAASYVHYLSPRWDKPLVKLNCACIPELLAESELFGYERGAFTGGLREGKVGKFQAAEGGTLFLDEIGDLSIGIQTKFLRVLEEKSYFRIGGTREIHCNVRVVAATNKNLLEEANKGQFREDLYYRLSPLKVLIPPLRERREDILQLAQYFLNQCCKKNGRPVMHLSPEAGEILKRHIWKGNSRELRNAMERIVLLENAQVIYPEHLDFLKESYERSQTVGELALYIDLPRKLTYDEMMEKLLITALSEAEGNQVKAAKLLGISRAKLRYQITKYGLKI